jgi:electron transport complex protein RnfG
LIVSAFFFGLLIAVANAGWEPRIKQNEIDKRNRLMKELIADGNSFAIAAEKVKIPGRKSKVTTTTIYGAVDSSGKRVGFAFIAVGSGFADKIKLVIALGDGGKKLYGFRVLAHNETPGFGSKIKEEDFLSNQFVDAPTERFVLVKSGDEKVIDSEIVAISGATVSSEAVVKIINSFIRPIKEHMQNKGLITDGK